MPGFLGTRASFLSDLLLVSLLLLVPAFSLAYFFARRHQGDIHRLIMLSAYVIVVFFVIIYVIHNLVDGFPPARGGVFSLYNLIYFSTGLVHSTFAVLALIFGGRQLFTGYLFTRGRPTWSMKKEKRFEHRKSGNRALIFFALTASSGIFFYYSVFISTYF